MFLFYMLQAAAPEKATPSEQAALLNTIPEGSFLHDASEVQLISKKGKVKLSFDPKAAHAKLAQLDNNANNVANFFITFLTGDANKGRKCVNCHNVDGPFTSGYTEGLFPSYERVLELLAEHNQHHEKNFANIEATIEDGDKTHICNQLHHSEQWILIELRNKIKTYIDKLMEEHDDVKKIYGVTLNLYSTNDPCQWCGETIQKFLPLFKEEIEKYLGKKDIKMPKKFSVFAEVSSSNRYGISYLNRPVENNLENNPDYWDFYKNHESVRKGRISLKDLKGNAVYFWTPRPGPAPVKEVLPQTSAKYKGQGSVSKAVKNEAVRLAKEGIPTKTILKALNITGKKTSETIMNHINANTTN